MSDIETEGPPVLLDAGCIVSQNFVESCKILKNPAKSCRKKALNSKVGSLYESQLAFWFHTQETKGIEDFYSYHII